MAWEKGIYSENVHTFWKTPFKYAIFNMFLSSSFPERRPSTYSVSDFPLSIWYIISSLEWVPTL